MSNPYLPAWEYIPDGEPRVFGDRLYIYGSHDRPASDSYCDNKLKVWSAPLSDLEHWTCHGVIFHTMDERNHSANVTWTENSLYAPDVIEYQGKYYLYVYIVDAPGCVAVADKPEGPFTLLAKYKHNLSEDICPKGTFVDPGILVDDDGRVYIYCGYKHSYMAEISGDNMYQIIDGSYVDNIIPWDDDEAGFFEACSPRKIDDTYYLIYSPTRGCRLAYATSDKPSGPFVYRGYIIDNGIDYPGGNNHGSICYINNQWYIFYHRTTNGTYMSRRGCVEKINILEDGTIPTVEMTSLGFQNALNPYEIQPADIACVLTGGCFITEQNPFTRMITQIQDGCIIGYKYFDFGDDENTQTMKFAADIIGTGCISQLHIYIDEISENTEIGICKIGTDSSWVSSRVKAVTGRHAIYFKAETTAVDWSAYMFTNRPLFELKQFVFMK